MGCDTVPAIVREHLPSRTSHQPATKTAGVSSQGAPVAVDTISLPTHCREALFTYPPAKFGATDVQ